MGEGAKVPIPIVYVNYHGTVGGGQIHLLALLDELDRAQFTPHVVCCQDGPFLELLRQKGVEPIMVPFGKGKRRYILTALQAWRRFYNILKQTRARLVQASGLQEAKLAAYPCAWAKVPMLWVVAP
ncbi:MAG: glycosyltransferase family 4 protein [candidate division FCPU426 bacterium]